MLYRLAQSLATVLFSIRNRVAIERREVSPDIPLKVSRSCDATYLMALHHIRLLQQLSGARIQIKRLRNLLFRSRTSKQDAGICSKKAFDVLTAEYLSTSSEGQSTGNSVRSVNLVDGLNANPS